VTFRVSGGRIHSLRMVTECGTYTAASVAVRHGDFSLRTGPATRPLQIDGRFTSSTRADLLWNVGYSATVMPTCLLHEEWTAVRRGP
jgi:hypothetical protein